MNRPLLSLSLAMLLPWSPALAGRTSEFTPADRAWWSFQPVREPALPEVKNASWGRTPVDRFILDRLERAGLGPAVEASKVALVRRVYFDVIGLPPTQEQVEAFVRDPAPDAWEKLVDRLLASPHYGERQARLWLDLVRYADSDGYKADDYRPDAWRYRDYVIAAFNADKPYDRFLSEQLAGDELFPESPEALVATGYLRHWIYEYNNRDAAGQWNLILNDITDTTADVFMGLGLQCARCHDHKFDPLLQADYYRLQAFFAPLDPRDGTVILTPAHQAEYQAQQEKWELATAGVRQRIGEIQAPERENARRKAISMFPPETQALLEKPAADRTPREQQIAALAWKQVLYEWERVDSRIKGGAKEQLIGLRKELAGFEALKPSPPPTALTAADVGPVAPPVTIPRREAEGNILPGFPSLLAPEPAAVTARPGSTGRRSALAAWLARPDNPLTARVMVNRVWQQHFGKGLVATSSDLGTLGDKPSHPELLDWLAHHFTDQGWSLKELHRLILTSAAWRQGHLSTVAERARVVDPENRLLWRWTTRRLEAEQIRDAIFQASGELDLQAGGPGVDASKPRRTIYTKILRNVRDPLTEVFDAPQNFQSTASRDTTTTATQSLFLANSRFMADRAGAMALTLSTLPDRSSRIEAAWWRAHGRAPSTDEREDALAFLDAATLPEPVLTSAPLPETMPQRYGKAAALSPGSALERLEAEAPDLPPGGFTFEAVALLHSVSETEALRTLAGQWSGDAMASGWAVGITGTNSQRKSQMPVLILSGADGTGQLVQETVCSDFALQLDRSYYLGISIQPASTAHSGTVTFFVKDLANEDEPLLTISVPHPVTSPTAPSGPLFIGDSNDRSGGLWDGLIDEVRLSRGLLKEEELALRHPGITGRTLACWQFEPGSFRHDAVTGRDTIRVPQKPVTTAPAQEALSDLCHALLSSSGLLYVE